MNPLHLILQIPTLQTDLLQTISFTRWRSSSLKRAFIKIKKKSVFSRLVLSKHVVRDFRALHSHADRAPTLDVSPFRTSDDGRPCMIFVTRRLYNLPPPSWFSLSKCDSDVRVTGRQNKKYNLQQKTCPIAVT